GDRAGLVVVVVHDLDEVRPGRERHRDAQAGAQADRAAVDGDQREDRGALGRCERADPFQGVGPPHVAGGQHERAGVRGAVGAVDGLGGGARPHPPPWSSVSTLANRSAASASLVRQSSAQSLMLVASWFRLVEASLWRLLISSTMPL